mgnify:CR=1 FL=1
MGDPAVTQVLQVFTDTIMGWVNMVMPYMIAATVVIWSLCFVLAWVKHKKKKNKK